MILVWFIIAWLTTVAFLWVFGPTPWYWPMIFLAIVYWGGGLIKLCLHYRKI